MFSLLDAEPDFSGKGLQSVATIMGVRMTLGRPFNCRRDHLWIFTYAALAQEAGQFAVMAEHIEANPGQVMLVQQAEKIASL